MSVARSIAPVVLLVQPNRDDREMYAEFLRHSGFTPVVVSSATAALSFASDADVIVTGLLLEGGMDGVELITRLRGGDRAKKKVTIIVLTSCAWTSERERARAAGCDVFLTKPCLPDVLVHEIRRRLPSSAGSPRRRPAKVPPPGSLGARRPPKRAG